MSHTPNPFSPMNAVTGAAGIFLGIIVGFVIGAGQAQPGASPAAIAPDDHIHSPTAAVVDEGELQAYRDILARDPTNVKAATELGNRLYDAGRYGDAIPAYQQALALDPRNVNISTDLGTAMYYAGRTDEALAQLEKSLAIDPAHAQTLFNVGIIRRDGRKDAKGAVEAWERLLKVAPDYPDAAKVRTLIAQANGKV
jgi:cytochrome c-type biogenesis protein CcmH/NrfG